MQTNYEAEQLSMFDQDLWYGKMFPVPLVQERQRAKTSESFWRRSSALSAIPFQSLDLTPLECERLQGFPDGWTDIPGASDSARYKALGNSVAIPCVEFIMGRIAAALRAV